MSLNLRTQKTDGPARYRTGSYWSEDPDIDGMKILMFGNCQMEAVRNLLSFSNSRHDLVYAGNSGAVSNFHPEHVFDQIREADFVVSQPIMNKENTFHHEVLRKHAGDKIIFMPYIFLDGLYSMTQVRGRPDIKSTIFEEELIHGYLQEHGLSKTCQMFLHGEIEFRHQERLASSMERLEWRERFCDVTISGFLKEHLRTFRDLMLNHNHPHPAVINQLCKPIAERMDLVFKEINQSDPVRFSQITLPIPLRIMSPYTVADHQLEYSCDLDWGVVGERMIKLVQKSFDAPAPTGSSRKKWWPL